ncbi:hypothetical protein OF83DRAFT_1095987 [Amylostereum chailletii]|nr:hypothetical protein OF83DRAFT_1095987 [Amylostereum chailletii]
MPSLAGNEMSIKRDTLTRVHLHITRYMRYSHRQQVRVLLKKVSAANISGTQVGAREIALASDILANVLHPLRRSLPHTNAHSHASGDGGAGRPHICCETNCNESFLLRKKNWCSLRAQHPARKTACNLDLLKFTPSRPPAPIPPSNDRLCLHAKKQSSSEQLLRVLLEMTVDRCCLLKYKLNEWVLLLRGEDGDGRIEGESTRERDL